MLGTAIGPPRWRIGTDTHISRLGKSSLGNERVACVVAESCASANGSIGPCRCPRGALGSPLCARLEHGAVTGMCPTFVGQLVVRGQHGRSNGTRLGGIGSRSARGEPRSRSNA